MYDHGTHAYFYWFLKITDTFVQHTWNDKIVDFTLFVKIWYVYFVLFINYQRNYTLVAKVTKMSSVRICMYSS